MAPPTTAARLRMIPNRIECISVIPARCGPASRANRTLAAVETTIYAVDLFDWVPRFPVCIIFGHEVDGISPEISALCDTHVRIPMLGSKHSLNVATAGGVVIYELLRKYRNLCLPQRRGDAGN